MDPGAFIGSHGYWVLAVGCLLEGETILALAGYAAHLGHLDMAWVVVVGAVCGFAGDQFYFWLGRRHGRAVLGRFPAVGRQAARVHRLMERYHNWVIVGVRFAYGLRIAGPILIGTSAIPAGRFVLFNALGAILWALLVAGFGWGFRELAQGVLGEVGEAELWLLAGLALVVALPWWISRSRRRSL